MKKILFLTLICSVSFANAQWTQTNFPAGVSNIQCIAVNGNNIFAGTIGNGVLVSTDNGNNWTVSNNGLTSTIVESLAINGSNVFADDWVYGVALSTNNGTSWTHTSSCPPMAYDFAISGSNIFAGGLYGVWLSSNNGTSWTKVLSSHNVMSLAISGSTIYAGTDSSKVYKSTNNGSNWSLVNNGLPASPYQIQTLSICGSYVYAALWGSGLYVSNNGGANWTSCNNGLSFALIYSLATDGSKIIAGGAPLSLSNDNGANWITVRGGLPVSCCVTSLTISGSYIYAGIFVSANNCSVWKCPLSELTGIEEISNNESSITVYPNPATNNITIEIPQQAVPIAIGIKIYNIQGQLIKNFTASGNITSVDVSSFPSDVYVVEVQTEKGVAIKKFVKK
jgi:hypothetical protein